ncbi:DUF4192 domain-containing protein [Actinoplanes utahensis]|uniref:DUF4192 domain-containing protein n=1 Tax=Actinoplanes utahensis TaxID=1869 RepID=A0A0A6UCV3_ACTUT|nr:DUF4192 domain-containing protein [Actinoplanes utahensis]KHD72903.1 hypothetical protein MB27_37365 [Actinoplanes utahensis]GIF31055.1 hypothetical protein Aut01nite_40410 [Actinoplanes utahensis]
MRSDCSLPLGTPAEFLAALPYLLGYHPHDAVALIGLRGHDLEFGACFDLPPPGLGAEVLRAGAAEIAVTIARQEPQAVVIVGYGPPQRITPMTMHLVEALRVVEVRVSDAIRVSDGRWWSYLCSEPRCCPPDGGLCLPPDSVIAARATYLGHVALPSRADLVTQVAAVEGQARQAMVAATERARGRFAGLLTDERAGRRIKQAGRLAVREVEKRYRAGAALTDDDVAWIGVLLVDRATEDYALDRCGADDWRISLWTDVLRRVEPVYVPAPACLLGFTAWRAGLGALARVAVNRALLAEPGHQLARMLDELLDHGISPGTVTRWAPE